jgi:hypothetical protein
MQYLVIRPAVLAVALTASVSAFAAPAGADGLAIDGADARTAAARLLFRAENAVDAGTRAQPVAAPELAQRRGGTDSHADNLAQTRNDMRLDGAVGANTAVNVVSGANRIDSGSFANMAGIPVVIQNSGANVLIQSATIINLQFK